MIYEQNILYNIDGIIRIMFLLQSMFFIII